MLKLFNDFATVLINNIFIPCFGVEWKAWVLLLTCLVFYILCIICVVLIIKYRNIKDSKVELVRDLEIAENMIGTKSTQINQLTENLAIAEGKLKTAKITNDELESQITANKEAYEKEIAQLKLEIEDLSKVNAILAEAKKTEVVVEEAKEETISVITEEVKKPKASTKKKKSTTSKKTQAKKSEEKIKEEK